MVFELVLLCSNIYVYESKHFIQPILNIFAHILVEKEGDNDDPFINCVKRLYENLKFYFLKLLFYRKTILSSLEASSSPC